MERIGGFHHFQIGFKNLLSYCKPTTTGSCITVEAKSSVTGFFCSSDWAGNKDLTRSLSISSPFFPPFLSHSGIALDCVGSLFFCRWWLTKSPAPPSAGYVLHSPRWSSLPFAGHRWLLQVQEGDPGKEGNQACPITICGTTSRSSLTIFGPQLPPLQVEEVECSLGTF